MSTTDRLRSLLALAEQDPDNDLVRYGLAMEFAKLDRAEEALESFRLLIGKNPSYVAAYYQMGALLAKRGDIEDARNIYCEGVKAAVLKADWHAKSELEAALESL